MTAGQSLSTSMDPRHQLGLLVGEIRKTVIGQDRVLERLLACLLARGHALLEGVPGVGKTLTLSTLATAVGGTFTRIQFTPDLLPSDITGNRIYKPSTETFDVEPGPVFANFVLADEINRAPAKVQSALLEVMGEGQVTIGAHTLHVPNPFLVVASQNPIESEGVYELPEAQRDRFMMRIHVGFPEFAEEWRIVDSALNPAHRPVTAVLDPAQLTVLQGLALTKPVPKPVKEYALRLVFATRFPTEMGVPDLRPVLAAGVGPRASIALVRAAQGLALLRGHKTVGFQEVFDCAYDVLNHRLSLTYEAIADGATVGSALAVLLAAVGVPGETWTPDTTTAGASLDNLIGYVRDDHG